MNLSKFIYYSACIFLLTSHITFAQNIRAIEDGFDLLEDGELIVDSEFGVLSNDVLGAGSAVAILKSDPKKRKRTKQRFINDCRYLCSVLSAILP